MRFQLEEQTAIKLAIKELQFHLFTFKIDDEIYWAVDSLQVLEFRNFQEIAFSIFNVYGLIKNASSYRRKLLNHLTSFIILMTFGLPEELLYQKDNLVTLPRR